MGQRGEKEKGKRMAARVSGPRKGWVGSAQVLGSARNCTCRLTGGLSSWIGSTFPARSDWAGFDSRQVGSGRRTGPWSGSGPTSSSLIFFSLLWLTGWVHERRLLLPPAGQAHLSVSSSPCLMGPVCQRLLDPLWLLPDLVWLVPSMCVCVRPVGVRQKAAEGPAVMRARRTR